MDPDNSFTKIITSDYFKKDDGISIQSLMLFGIVYCQGTNKEKVEAFYDLLQDGL